MPLSHFSAEKLFYFGVGVVLMLTLTQLVLPRASRLLYSAMSTTTTTATASISTSEPGGSSVAYVTVPNMEVAKKISHGLVTSKLAACVNIIPGVTSVYEWEGKVISVFIYFRYSEFHACCVLVSFNILGSMVSASPRLVDYTLRLKLNVLRIFGRSHKVTLVFNYIRFSVPKLSFQNIFYRVILHLCF